jgi:DNA-binding Lrp family transcriptional regulator
MRRICEEEKLRGIFSDGLPHSVSEVGKRFKLSVPVAYNELRRLKALVALNRPGVYVLPKVRRTDNAGFFKVGDAVFFSGGNLPRALESLVSGSSSGMSVRDIEKIVLTNAKVQLLSLVSAGKLKRRKTGGEYRYFSSDAKIRKLQEDACRNEFSDSERTRCLELAEKIPLEDVLKILVTHIGNPKFSPKGVALSLIRRGEDIRTETVKAVFEKYDIVKKNWPPSS